LLVLATLGEGLKGTALVISKLKQKPAEPTAAAESRSAEEEVRKCCSLAGRNATEAGYTVSKNVTHKIHSVYIAFRLLNTHYRIQKSPSLDHILIRMNSVHTIIPYFHIILPSILGSPNGPFSSHHLMYVGFHAYLISLI
jgi:hypothetical protein